MFCAELLAAQDKLRHDNNWHKIYFKSFPFSAINMSSRIKLQNTDYIYSILPVNSFHFHSFKFFFEFRLTFGFLLSASDKNRSTPDIFTVQFVYALQDTLRCIVLDIDRGPISLRFYGLKNTVTGVLFEKKYLFTLHVFKVLVNRQRRVAGLQ